jgi:short-subunit dehydrogenase
MFDTVRGRRALVTGASRGLGTHIARGLAERGAELVLCARNAARLDRTAGECRKAGVTVKVVEADVCRAEDRARLLTEAGDIDILVNNAGVEVTKRLVDQTEDDVRSQIETNLVAPIDLMRRALPAMIARGRGVVVNVSSMSGKASTPFNSVYAATKHGLNGLSSSLDIELHGTGVHVGVVCPSFVAESGMWADTGLSAPALLREVQPSAVVDGVLQVIRGRAEVLVTPGPMRPMLALRELVPSVEGRILRWMGVARVLAARADRAAGG